MVFLQLKNEITFLFFTFDTQELLGRTLSTPPSRYHEQIRNVRNILLVEFKYMCPKCSSNILTISGSSNFPIAIFRAQL